MWVKARAKTLVKTVLKCLLNCTPGSIFIVLSGGLEVVGLSTTLAFILNLIPLIFFIVVCYYDKSKGHANTIALAQLLRGAIQ